MLKKKVSKQNHKAASRKRQTLVLWGFPSSEFWHTNNTNPGVAELPERLQIQYCNLEMAHHRWGKVCDEISAALRDPWHSLQGWWWHPLCSWILSLSWEGSDAGHWCWVSFTSQTDQQLPLSPMLLHLCCSYSNRPFLAASNLNLFAVKHQPYHRVNVFL